MGGTLCCSAKVNGQPLSTVATVEADAKHNKQLPLTRPRLGRLPPDVGLERLSNRSNAVTSAPHPASLPVAISTLPQHQ